MSVALEHCQLGFVQGLDNERLNRALLCESRGWDDEGE
jgi:hypothetical protein